MMRVQTYGLLFLLLISCNSKDEKPAINHLEEVFLRPSDSARPWTYWYWMDANATAEGVERDLVEMAQSGIGCTYLMPIGHEGPNTRVEKPANPLSDYWWDLLKLAVRKADSLGMQIAMNACDGWALAGGPWITPELSMQELTSSRIQFQGGQKVAIELPLPFHREDYYRDIAVLAFPSMEGTGLSSSLIKPSITTSIAGIDSEKIALGELQNVTLKGDGWIQFEFEEAFTCRSIKLSPGQRSGYQLHRAEFLASDNGMDWKSLGRLNPSKFHGWQDDGLGATHAIPEVSARFFRLDIQRGNTPEPSENREGSKVRNRNNLSIREIEISSEPVIHQWEGKAGFRWRRSMWTSPEVLPQKFCIDPEELLDITQHLDEDGVLNWEVPEGKWSIIRLGYTTTGAKNGPGGTGSGLECDKFSPEAAKVQFDNWFGKALDKVSPDHAGKILHYNHTDSWEAKSQNWSPRFRAEFTRLRGYDPLPWLPTMQGIPIGSAELSERFLYDVRRTIADLVCESFYRPMTELGHERGTEFTAENIAPTMMADGLQHFRYVDSPMGEFWLNSPDQDKPNDIMDAVKGGHIYGKKIIGAEAFTQNPIQWDESPYLLKAIGDYNFAMGINRFILHVWAHQYEKGEPGQTLWFVGTFFSGNQTWHESGRAWFDYLHRCSSLLQQGLPVEDVCYFTGEEQPSRSYLRKDLPLKLPEGYSYGCINRDALLNLAEAKNGKLVMPDGLSFHALILPPTTFMSPELAKKIGQIAQAGVPVIATPPSKSISLSDYPDCDKKLAATISSSWGNVRQDLSLESLLDEVELEPDVIFHGTDLTPVFREREGYFSPAFVWNHRKKGDAEIYFLSHQEKVHRKQVVSFRSNGKVPELWDASTGKIMDAPHWEEVEGRTVIHIDFDPAGSVFVIFRRLATREDKKSGLQTRGMEKQMNMVFEEAWQLNFQEHRGAPGQTELIELMPLNEHQEAGIRHFSGRVTYKNSFIFDANEITHPNLVLDLGKVACIARVWMNGVFLGTAWKPPYQLELDIALLKRSNELVIEVTNTWKNRLILDSQLPPEDRVTRTFYQFDWFGTDTTIDPSGLIGPIKLIGS